MCRRLCDTLLAFLALLGWPGGITTARADGAARDLSAYESPGVPFTATISIDPPNTVYACGLEEEPPAGWAVSNISHSGAWDAQTRKVKWGPFFDPSIPLIVTYDVTPPAGASGRFCFSGTVVFDGDELPVSGDDCLAVAVPAVSGWGLMAMALVMALAASVRLKRFPPVPA